MSKYAPLKWNADYEQAAMRLLEAHRSSAVLLMSVLSEYGPNRVDGAHYSANIMCIVEGQDVRAVFGMNGCGEVLIVTDKEDDYSSLILKACLKEGIPLTGCDAEWSVAEPFWSEVRRVAPDVDTTCYSKEVHYTLNLNGFVNSDTHRDIRFLEPRDFEAWDKLNRAYLIEQAMPVHGNDESRRLDFNDKVRRRAWWGLYQGLELIGIAYLDGMSHKAGHIRGVFIDFPHRKKGHGTRLLLALCQDSKEIHGLSELILYTETTNTFARRIYEAIGFQQIGYFGLIYCEPYHFQRSNLIV